MGENLDGIGHGDNILDTTTKEQSVKEIIYQLDLVITKRFCSKNDNGKRIRQATDWEKNTCKKVQRTKTLKTQQ